VLRGSLLALLIADAAAHADSTSWSLTANGNVAATDNVFAVARDNNPEFDLFTQVRPGMLFAYNSPRFINELTAEVEFLEYALHSDRPSVTERASWKGFVLPGPRSEMLLSVDGSTGQMNALSSRSTPDQTGPTILPPTQAVDVYQASANEYGGWTATKATHLSETGFVRWSATDDQLAMPTKTGVIEAGGQFGIDYAWKHDSLALEAGGSYLKLDRDAAAGVMPGSLHQRQANPRAIVSWRHDFDKAWSAAVDGGGIYVHPLDHVGRRDAPFPIFGAVLAYTETWGRATLSARRSVTPDPYLAVDTVNESVITQVAMPLPWLDDNPHARMPKLVGLASVGVERAQMLDPLTDAFNGEVYDGRIDAGAAWTPRPGQTWGLRYEFVYQHGDSSGAIPTTSFFRNTLYLTFALRYPDKVAAQVPRRTQSVRADRKDLAPVGAEPVVPDPTEQLQEGGDDDSGGGDRR